MEDKCFKSEEFNLQHLSKMIEIRKEDQYFQRVIFVNKVQKELLKNIMKILEK